MPDYWLPQDTREQQQDASDYEAVRSYESAWAALARAVRESKPVLAAAFGRELRDTALKQCRKMASDWHGDPYRQDYQEYVSVAAVWACGKAAAGKWVAGMLPAVVSTAVKNAILIFIYGEQPDVYGCGPDSYQRSNKDGKRPREKLANELKAPISDDAKMSPLDLESLKQGYGRTKVKLEADEGERSNDDARYVAQVPSGEQESDGLTREQLEWFERYIVTPALDRMRQDNPDDVDAFERAYMGSRFPGNRRGWGESRAHIGADYGITDEGVTKRANKVRAALREQLGRMSRWRSYDPGFKWPWRGSVQGFGGEIPCPGAERVVNGRIATDPPDVLALARREDNDNQPPVTVTMF